VARRFSHTIFVGGVLPLLAIIAYSALAASAAFETQRNPTWIVFSALAVVTFCWGSCDTIAGRDRYDANGQVIVAKIDLPRPPPQRLPAKPAEAPDAGPIAETWALRVTSIPPGATVVVDGAQVGRAPVDVQVAGDKESVTVRLSLGAGEKVVTATKDQLELLVSMPAPPTLHFDGLYHATRGNGHHWLRFSMGGQVAAIESSRDVPAKKMWRTIDSSKNTGRYKFVRDRLMFTLSSTEDAKTRYQGTVEADRLQLQTQGDAKPVEYRFLKP
jgi:hypothetical protein